MNIRLACALAAAALLTVLSTQTYARDTFKTPKTPVSLTGCIQREVDYRRQHHSGKGGFLGFGGGLGNEYVLINTSPRRGSRDCATASGGEAYELTGSEEGDLKRFVGQRVAITGTRKAAEIDAVTVCRTACGDHRHAQGRRDRRRDRSTHRRTPSRL